MMVGLVVGRTTVMVAVSKAVHRLGLSSMMKFDESFQEHRGVVVAIDCCYGPLFGEMSYHGNSRAQIVQQMLRLAVGPILNEPKFPVRGNGIAIWMAHSEGVKLGTVRTEEPESQNGVSCL